ncbi:MAG: helix-turn-helix transcriptional regulator [Sediminicola sp.]|tara:strand:+ start:26077 stop:27108 length:1032 start_codon:yes stop_codon:yes gene_type:complete
MDILHVKSLPLAEVIRDLASEFGVGYTSSCNRYVVQLPETVGAGHIFGINFASGLGIIHYDCTFLEDVEIHFTVDKTHPLKFLFCQEGAVDHQFQNDNVAHNIELYKSAIVASSAFNGHILKFKAKSRTVLSSLEIDRLVFRDYMDCELNSMNAQLREVFTDINASKTFYYEGFYSLGMSKIFKEINGFSGNLILERMALEGHTFQILARQMEQFEDDISEESKRSVFRRSEIHQIEKAQRMIKQELSNLRPIPEIAKEVGLNVNKLQQGFQQLYGRTVNDFIMETRLSTASTLLLETQLSISEIMYRIGLNSQSYISKIFKDHYGLSPSEFRERAYNKDNNK